TDPKVRRDLRERERVCVCVCVKEMEEVKLKSTPLTSESFQPYGQVIGPSTDDTLCGPQDAQLHLSAGTRRGDSVAVMDIGGSPSEGVDTAYCQEDRLVLEYIG
ncbi:hypothetical protein L7F22_039848, partial [Adiantum nelumboides]|nr:hypothetical protein [Adiantum nelumboides]